MHTFQLLHYRNLRGKLRVITVTLPALRTLLTYHIYIIGIW